MTVRRALRHVALSPALAALVLVAGATAEARAQVQAATGRAPAGRVCGDATARCAGAFRPFDLTFELPDDSLARAEWRSSPFWAVILASAGRCAIGEPERVRTQRRFARRQVFASRFGCDDEALVGYLGADTAHAFLAVWAGPARRDALRLRDSLRARGAFPGANARRLVAVLHYP